MCDCWWAIVVRSCWRRKRRVFSLLRLWRSLASDARSRRTAFDKDVASWTCRRRAYVRYPGKDSFRTVSRRCEVRARLSGDSCTMAFNHSHCLKQCASVDLVVYDRYRADGNVLHRGQLRLCLPPAGSYNACIHTLFLIAAISTSCYVSHATLPLTGVVVVANPATNIAMSTEEARFRARPYVKHNPVSSQSMRRVGTSRCISGESVNRSCLGARCRRQHSSPTSPSGGNSDRFPLSTLVHTSHQSS